MAELQPGYVQSELVEEALKLFCQLPHRDIKPDEFIFSSVLSACARLSAFEQGYAHHGLMGSGEYQFILAHCNMRISKMMNRMRI
ncbi:hypothetical protein SUGI_0838420 [Cryptomeria japonica]|nr:hypothetical protein SUGI_0838420 [Cryptomeria japonica]